ncbi:hypothetical protein LFM09_49805 [Lentzea alba]|uniref:hypothetical protein n=1 Tax=Lentzea alba TaxID=2714351 RepID=UPI0039BED69B
MFKLTLPLLGTGTAEVLATVDVAVRAASSDAFSADAANDVWTVADPVSEITSDSDGTLGVSFCIAAMDGGVVTASAFDAIGGGIDVDEVGAEVLAEVFVDAFVGAERSGTSPVVDVTGAVATDAGGTVDSGIGSPDSALSDESCI